MTSQDLYRQLATGTGFTLDAVKALMATLTVAIRANLKNGEEVPLAGVGKLTVKDRAARVARNPRSGAKVNVPAKKAVAFKPSKELSASLMA